MKDLAFIFLIAVIVSATIGFLLAKQYYDNDVVIREPIFSTIVKTDTVRVNVPIVKIKAKLDTIIVVDTLYVKDTLNVSVLDTMIVKYPVKNWLFVAYSRKTDSFWLKSKYEVAKDTVFVTKEIPIEKTVYKNSFKDDALWGSIGFLAGVLTSTILIMQK